MASSEERIPVSNAVNFFGFFAILSSDLKRNPGLGLLLLTVCNAALNLSSHSLTLAVGEGTE